MVSQDFIHKLDRIAQWSLLILVIFGGGGVVFILAIILVYLFVSGVI